jgi:hypothetical protein
MNVDMYPSCLFVNMVILAIDKDLTLFINGKKFNYMVSKTQNLDLKPLPLRGCPISSW